MVAGCVVACVGSGIGSCTSVAVVVLFTFGTSCFSAVLFRVLRTGGEGNFWGVGIDVEGT